MSHFTRVKTRMVQQDHLVAALRDLGHNPQVGDLKARGFLGFLRTKVDVKIPAGTWGFDIGFRHTPDGYEMVADWEGARGIKRNEFLQQLQQRYAYHATRAKLQDQGFDLVAEEKQPDGRIHLVLRRMA
jgi:hypothetical protein